MTDIAKKKLNSFKINWAFILLFIVILITIWLYWYNRYIESKNNIISDRIKTKEVEINDIKKDKNIQVYSLIIDNRKVLNKLESYSQITKFINWLTEIEDNYNLILDWFNYSNWIITTKARTNPDKISSPYIAVSDFIEEYRKDKKAKFKLPFIWKVIWNSEIAFNLKLEVKDNLINKK